MNPVFKLLGYFMPNRMKRVVVMSSIIGNLTKKNDIDDETLEKINNLVNICDRHSAIALPMKYNRTLWNEEVIHEADNLDENKYLNQSKKTEDREYIISRIPSYLHYESKSMQDDVDRILQRRSDIVDLTNKP